MPSKYETLMAKYPFFQKLSRVECGEGWHDLIKNLCAELERLTLGPNFQVIEVKQKLGELRFYVENVPNGKRGMVYKLIQETEKKSRITCEYCGQKGKRVSIKWVTKTLCENCKKK